MGTDCQFLSPLPGPARRIYRTQRVTMREVGRMTKWVTRDAISVRRNSIIKSHEGTWRIMNKQDRNEDVSKSKVHSAPSLTPKQKEAWRATSPLNFKSHFVRYQCHVCLPACPRCHHREKRKTCIFYQDISLSSMPVLRSASLSLLQTFVFYRPSSAVCLTRGVIHVLDGMAVSKAGASRD